MTRTFCSNEGDVQLPERDFQKSFVENDILLVSVILFEI